MEPKIKMPRETDVPFLDKTEFNPADNSTHCQSASDTISISSTLISTTYSSSSTSSQSSQDSKEIPSLASSISYYSARSTTEDDNYQSPLFDNKSNLETNDPALIIQPSIFSQTSSCDSMMPDSMKCPTQSSSQKQLSLTSSYTQFVQKYRPILHLLESSASKLFLYATSYSSNRPYISNKQSSFIFDPEVGYAILNLVSWTNNVIYYGVDKNHFGVTSSTKTLLSPSLHTHETSRLNNTDNSSLSLVFLLRTMLSGLDCIQPALEQIGTLQSIRNRKLSKKCPPSYLQNESDESFQHPWHMIVRIEKVKCLLRIVLMLYYHYQKYNNRRKELEKNREIPFHDDYGILETGGILLPGEEDERDDFHRQQVQKQKEEEIRTQKLLKGYIGRRTGWSGGRDNKQTSDTSNGNKGSLQTKVINCIKAQAIPGLFLVGDVLHIIRPYYYAKSQQEYHKYKSEETNYTPNGHVLKSPLRSWIVSLCMDLFSQKILSMGLSLQSEQRGPSLPSPCFERTKEELQRRKLRLLLYLLRSPIWYTITDPILLRVVDRVLGRTIGGYIRSVILCWQQHHFMLDD